MHVSVREVQLCSAVSIKAAVHDQGCGQRLGQSSWGDSEELYFKGPIPGCLNVQFVFKARQVSCFLFVFLSLSLESMLSSVSVIVY